MNLNKRVEELCQRLTEQEIWWQDGGEPWNISNNIDACEVIKDTLTKYHQDMMNEVVEELEERINYLTQNHLGKSAVEMGGFTNAAYQNHGQVMSLRGAQTIIKSKQVV